MLRGSRDRNRFIVVLVVQIIIPVRSMRAHCSVLSRLSVVSLMMRRLLCCRILHRVLSGLFALATFHLCLLEQPSFLRQSPALFAILDLILPDERFGRVAKNALILAEFAYPYVLSTRRVMEVIILLLDLTLTRGQRVDARC